MRSVRTRAQRMIFTLSPIETLILIVVPHHIHILMIELGYPILRVARELPPPDKDRNCDVCL